MTNSTKSVLTVLATSATLTLGYLAFRTDEPGPTVVRVDAVQATAANPLAGTDPLAQDIGLPPVTEPTTVPLLPYETESVQPNVQPFTREELRAVEQSQERMFRRGVAVGRAALAQAASALPIDQPLREGVAIPIVANLSVKRMNLLLGNNVCEPDVRLWNDPEWRKTVRMATDGTFPVNLWRSRMQGDGAREYTFVEQLSVLGGPQPSSPQFVLSAQVFRGGDAAVVEYTPALMIAVGDLFYSRCWNKQPGWNGAIVLPRISVIEPGSNDPTPPFGSWVRFSGEIQ